MAANAPLAIDYTAHGAASGWRAGEHLIDALPYVDPVRPEVRPIVEALIEEEKQRSTKMPSDYLREMPPVRAPQFDEHPVLKTEYERVRSKQPMAPLDTTRYRLDPPPQLKRGDLNAWRAALDNAQAQLEHQHLRILNQELLLKYGDKAWRAQVQLDEATVKGLEQQLAGLRKETDALNRERKLQQHAAGAELSKLERQYMAQVRKNADIERACARLEDEVAAMEAALQARIQKDTGGAQQQQQGAGPDADAHAANGAADGAGAEPMDASAAGEGAAEATGSAEGPQPAGEGPEGATAQDAQGETDMGPAGEAGRAEGEEQANGRHEPEGNGDAT